MRRFLAALVALIFLAVPANAAEDMVHIVPGSNINLVAKDARLPITINNPTDQDVTVVLKGQTTSFRLELIGDQEVTVPAGSSSVGELTVRAIANGQVDVRVWLELDGKQIGEDHLLEVNVNYDIELFLLVSFGFLVALLVILGVIRTAMKFARRNK